MRITRLYLKNYIGLYKGGGLKEIELNFNDKEIILLVGENGSGKTSLMDALTIMPDSKSIRPKKDGIKEIELEDGMNIYKVQHYYKASGKGTHKTSSFIQKIVNGKVIELNENGNVTSFKEVVEQELGVNDEYISLLRLGYSFSSFIQKTTAERSKFISTFLGEISIYLKYYKKVNEDSRILKNIIKSISSKLDMLGDKDELESRLSKVTIDLNKIMSEKEKISAQKLYLEKSIENINLDETSISINIDDDIIKTVFDNLKILDWKDIKKDEFILLEKERYSAVDHKMTVIKDNTLSIVKTLSDYENDIEDLESDIENIDKAECESIIKKYKSLVQLKTLLNEEYGFSNENNIPKYTKEKLFEGISLLDEYLVGVERIHSEFDSKTISDAIIMYSEGKNLYLELTSLLNEIEESRNKFSIITGRLTELNSTYKRVCENECKRPYDCKINNCPLIGGNKSMIEKEIYNIGLDKESLEKYINECKDKKKYLEDCIKIVSSISDIKKAFNYNKLIFDGIPFIHSTFDEYMKNIKECTPWYENNQLDDCSELIEAYEKWLDNNISINNLYQFYIEAEDSLKQYDSLTEKLNNMYGSKKIYENKLSNFINDQNNLKEEYGILKDMEENKSIYTEVIEYKDNLDKIKEDTKRYKETKKELDRLTNYTIDLIDGYNKLSKSKEQIGYKIIECEKYKEEKKIYSKKFMYVKYIKDALSSNKGIPLVYIDLYLEQARILANDLLQSAFGSKYQLEKFIINDKEFKIPFSKNDEIIEDVSLGSEGEKSILSLALSFAFIHQISSKFNIMFLDEVDGPLDKTNRKQFAFAVEKQMEFMGMEQIIIITHNDSFLTKNVGYILLKGYDMDNINRKNIIYEY